jgi:Ni/Co efflux regulator RcnB
MPPAAATPPTKPPEVGRHFDDKLRTAVRDHFTANRGSGPCPPGLIQKNSRCESPQSERAWKPGQPLPAQLTPRDLAAPLLAALGPAPAGHSYVQVDGDLLLINTASRVVIDAVLDLGQIAPRA